MKSQGNQDLGQLMLLLVTAKDCPLEPWQTLSSQSRPINERLLFKKFLK